MSTETPATRSRTKAWLRGAYTEARAAYAAGEMFTNEYALELDTMLSNYFGLPLIDPPEDEGPAPCRASVTAETGEA
jgi:hypothetical protein